MDTFSLYKPQDTSGMLPMTYFHAMAHLGITGLVIVEPSDVFVSVGYFDQTKSVIDLDACRRFNIPVIRREIGGGPVFLGPGQVFYQAVISKNSSGVPSSVYEAYRLFSDPVIRSYRRLGVEVSFKPINDLITQSGKKISGQGAADIEDMFCFVGAILRTFNIGLMAQLLLVPDEKFRDKLYKTLEENVTSIENETAAVPEKDVVVSILEQEFSKLLGSMEVKELPSEVINLANSLALEFTSDDILLTPTPKNSQALKVREGVEIRFGIHKSQGGLIRAETTVREGKIDELTLTGDFTFIPKNAFQPFVNSLIGSDFAFDSVCSSASQYFERNEVDMPGVDARDIAIAITGE